MHCNLLDEQRILLSLFENMALYLIYMYIYIYIYIYRMIPMLSCCERSFPMPANI